MADKTIGQLVAATNVTPTDLFVLEQSGTAKKLTGQILENWLVSFADGHGGIQSIVKTSTSGLVDTYTITLADTTTVTFTVTNGRGITGITTYYAVSSSGSTVPSTWSTTRQSMTATNRYLWSYQHIAFNGGSPSAIDTVKTVIGVWGDKGDQGDAGRGIVSLVQTSRDPGQYTLYTFNMSDGTTETFYSYDGVGISSIEKTASVGLVDVYTITYTNNTTTDFSVTNAKSITSIELAYTSGLTNVYRINFNDGTNTQFTVTNGSSIDNIEKTSTQGLVDTYTVTLTNGETDTFTVTNAKSISSIVMISGTHAAGTTDVYRITYNDGDTFDFSVYNGQNGTGAVSTVDGIPADGAGNVPLLITGNGAPTTTTAGNLYQRYFDLSTQILYICIGVDTSTSPATYSWAGTGVPVDSALSTTSQNPVQNAVITAKVGTAPLTTTAQNLSGAVNELDADLAALPATVAPLMDGTAAVGTSAKLARQDHRHPTDTSRASAAVEDAIAYVQSGDTASRTYTAGQFVYLKNHPTLAEGLYTVNSGGIPQANSVTGHLTASGNGFNLLTSKINKKIDYSKMIINSDGTGITQKYSIGNRGLGFPIFMLSIGFAAKSMAAIIVLNSSTENAIASFKIGGTGTLDISSITYDPSTQIISITFSSEPYRSGRLTSLNW